MTMTASATIARPPAAARRWPMTAEARGRLIDEIAQLRRDLAIADGATVEDGHIRLPLAGAGRRLETLLDVLDRAEPGDAGRPERAVIGSRVTLRDETGETVRYALVFPGDGDPALGWISADAPLGAAVLGSTPGDVVTVDAPLGPWSVTVVHVE